NGTADYVIEVKDNEGKNVNRFEMTVSFIDTKRLRGLLEECGFRSIKTYCGFDYGAFDDSCSEIVVMAEK
ncbi:hypothetical protein H0O02_02305, partial [Candidatus Micrarchaeota archaeon]|nr:hypothetical protein [Candidatus Micrarchaeota archaeon]